MSSFFNLTGTNSPVNEDVSTKPSPSRTSPSIGIVSPTLTIILSFTFNTFGSTSIILSSLNKVLKDYKASDEV